MSGSSESEKLINKIGSPSGKNDHGTFSSASSVSNRHGDLTRHEIKAIKAVIDETQMRRDKEKKVLYAALFFCAFFMVVELVGGYVANSLAILTDATHLMTDVGAYALSIYALYAAGRGVCHKYSYGQHRAEVIGTLVSVFSIWVLVALIVFAAINRIWTIWACSQVHPDKYFMIPGSKGKSKEASAYDSSAAGAITKKYGEGTKDGQQLDFDLFNSGLVCEEIDAKIMVVVGVLGMIVNVVCACILYFGGSHGHSHFGGAHGHSHGDGDDHGHSHGGDDHGHDHSHSHSHGHDHSHSHGDHGHSHGLETGYSTVEDCASSGAQDGIHNPFRQSLHGLGHSHIVNAMYGDREESEYTPSTSSEEDVKRNSLGEKETEKERKDRKRRERTGVNSEAIKEAEEAAAAAEGKITVMCDKDSEESTSHSSDDDVLDVSRPSSDDGTIDSDGEPEEGSLAAVAKHKKRKTGFALHAALLHALGDCVQSVGVIIAGAVIYLANMAVYGTHSYRFSVYNLADPVCSLLFAVVTVNMTKSLIGDLLSILMESTPPGIDYSALNGALKQIEGVESIHDLHVWSLSADYIALSVHLVASNPAKTLRKAKKICEETFSIKHTTIQVDSIEDGDNLCADTCKSNAIEM